MLKSRRKFIQSSIMMSFGFGLFSSLESMAFATTNLKKGKKDLVEIKGRICNAEQNPVSNTRIEIWHSNSSDDESLFHYTGFVSTNDKGEYRIITDFPEQHFEDGFSKMRRIFFNIKNHSGYDITTKLYLSSTKEAFVDNTYFEITNKHQRFELPTTIHSNPNITTVQFNLFLNL